jgi:hypothetical protein
MATSTRRWVRRMASFALGKEAVMQTDRIVQWDVCVCGQGVLLLQS